MTKATEELFTERLLASIRKEQCTCSETTCNQTKGLNDGD